MFIYLFIYIYIHMCMHTYIYIYMYTRSDARKPDKGACPSAALGALCDARTPRGIFQRFPWTSPLSAKWSAAQILCVASQCVASKKSLMRRVTSRVA